MKSRFLLLHLVLTLQLLAACDSPSGLSSSPQSSLAAVNVNVSTTNTGLRTVQIPIASLLPEAIQMASHLAVIFDASNTSVDVQRNADGSLSFPLNTSRSFDSNQELNILMVADRQQTFALKLRSGVPFQLDTPPIAVTPDDTVTLGTRLQLQARIRDDVAADNLTFSWEAATAASGPWQAIAGSQPGVAWEPQQAGAYYIRLRISDQRTQSQSSYISPTPQVYVQRSETIAQTEPPSGRILSGEDLGLKLSLPEFASADENLSVQWFYASSAQGPFQPISSQGREIRWEPPAAGSYFLRARVAQAGSLSTYTSERAQVVVAAAEDILSVSSSAILRGESVNLSASLPAVSGASYQWLYSVTPQGPFTAIAGDALSLSWTPREAGEFYLRLRVSTPERSDTYTSSTRLLSVRDSNEVFSLQPSPANLSKGQSVQLSLNNAPSEQVNWSYASTPQGPFQPIPNAGSSILWSPPEAGRYYLRASATRPDGSQAEFASASALVFVNEVSVLRSEPAAGSIALGQSVRLRAELPESTQLRYSWSFSSTPQGPFQPLPSLDNPGLSSVLWYPVQAGAYYVRVDVTNPLTQGSFSFTSDEPMVRVNSNQPFFSTDPLNGRIERNDVLRISSRFETGGRSFNLGWAYSRSSSGPFIPMGGSTAPAFVWDDLDKPVGSYYVRLQATAPGSNNPLTFVSDTPLIFVSENNDSGNFGVNQLTE
ncbi:MAG: hypothetical protein IGS03_04180 [Candidatus Sericytochromatia bacterium]|nr:hypothetical protein [Candidatus Sericytochromatia bacterium]